jgi:hypothetical protein
VENEQPIPRPEEERLASDMPDPSGPPLPMPKKSFGAQLLTGLGTGTVVVGGLFLAAVATTGSTCGATRSTKLDWETRQAEIAQAVQQDAAATPPTHEADHE